MFDRVGGLTARHPWLTVAVWLAAGIALARLAPSWDSRAQDDDINFLPARCPSVKGYKLLQEAFPQDVYASRLVFAFERRGSALTQADLALVDGVAKQLARLRDSEPSLQIKKILTQRDPFVGKRLLSEDGQCTLVQVSLGTPYLALRTRDAVERADRAVRSWLAEQGGEQPEMYTTGPAGVGRDLITAGGNSLDGTTIATVLLVIVILLCVYRSPVMALIPLASIALAVWVALNILALCTLIPGFVLVNISQIFAVVMLYGAGTDYCLFLISRYREELGAGKGRVDAIRDAVGGVGGALAASAGTVICGLGMMATAEFAKVKCGGPAIAVSLAIALLASLTLTPALLSVCGRWAFWPVGAPRRARTQDEAEGIWAGISRMVMARPILIWTVSFALLVPLAILGLRVRPSYRATAELSNHCSSVRGLDAIGRHFTPGELGPVTVLLEGEKPWDSEEGRRIIEHLTLGFGTLENVAEVRSLTHPLGKPVTPATPPAGNPSKPIRKNLFEMVGKSLTDTFNDQVEKATKGVYLSSRKTDGGVKHVTRLDVVLKTEPFDPRSGDTLMILQEWVSEGLPVLTERFGEVRGETYGITVGSRDMALVTESDRTRINLLVLSGIFLILLVLVRNVGFTVYLLFTVLLSYYATLGATAILAHHWHGRPLGEVDWRVPFFLFTILVAVGEDYNIFLLSRALEEKEKHGGEEGLRRGLASTGGTITSCGLIMAGTFATLMLAGLNTLIQVGFALAFGVLIDTFIVRPFLVPAFTLWLWKGEPATAPAPEALPLPRTYRKAG
jgi:RND superfamily putative drug exporter